ncbi:MAG: DUF721 domain-containing protein [Desulfovibrionaceae bacterium]|nr:DUF721 domain-containing protein [Desulfovibrionaceae bacterium]
MSKFEKNSTSEDEQYLKRQRILQRYRHCHPLIAQHEVDFQKILNSMDDEKIQADLAHLWECWDHVFGQTNLAELALPLGHEGDTLIIGCEDSMLIQELRMQESEILEYVNGFMFKQFFKKIRVILLGKNKNLNHQVKFENLPPSEAKPGAKLTGKFLNNMDKNSPVAKCYANFVKNNLEEN